MNTRTLIDSKTKAVLEVGSQVTTFRGDKAVIKSIPLHGNKIVLEQEHIGMGGTVFTGVIDAEFTD